MSANEAPASAGTRGRKGSVKEVPSLDDISSLLKLTEERLAKCFREEVASLRGEVKTLEKKLSLALTECSRLNEEVDTLKNVLCSQQRTIEIHEQKLKACNLIVHNIPEEQVMSGSTTLKDDREKIQALIHLNDIEVKESEVVSVQRIGQKRSDKTRPLKIHVTLCDSDKKFKFLNKRKFISTSSRMQEIFHNRIFVNVDSSFLVRKEEFRLRQRLKEVMDEGSGVKAYIRSGSLYVDGKVVDKVDVANQLF